MGCLSVATTELVYTFRGSRGRRYRPEGKPRHIECRLGSTRGPVSAGCSRECDPFGDHFLWLRITHRAEGLVEF